jgi:hypothetical protein
MFRTVKADTIKYTITEAFWLWNGEARITGSRVRQHQANIYCHTTVQCGCSKYSAIKTLFGNTTLQNRLYTMWFCEHHYLHLGRPFDLSSWYLLLDCITKERTICDCGLSIQLTHRQWTCNTG